ncbi:toll/interleukin-1 receptor domain-containing protein [Vreelandella boliviensis]|uniref:toll/interleukin-1 receptor domain-containing protein n=1 Tax=Vreelandella boliviensis TaxID=223527 RepID=UPI001B8C1DEB|nr:toll/interleukin-1 receptor domain-containing protein [Halomonas boliviensis]MBS3667070.1 toll/interleukin-1 receptor domain-containing protein [Halomonas boliviensis]
MANYQIFLSHIHEEKNLAVLIKQAIENEFSGFVEVFVSSDGTSIPAGSNFLNRIEDGLISCIGAVYLISPVSVKRSWISFELGAVWIRNAQSIRNEKSEIPTLPFCHSNMTPSNLPQPICNLNAILANQASQLEFAFRSIQSAVGGKGVLRTDFDLLAKKVVAFEKEYTLGATVADLFKSLGCNMSELIEHCELLPPGTKKTTLVLGFTPTELIQKIDKYQQNELAGKIHLVTKDSGLSIGSQGAIGGADASVTIDVALVLEFKAQLNI